MLTGVNIDYIQEAMANNARMIARLQPGEAISRALQYGVTALHRGAVQRAHVYEPGYWRGGQLWFTGGSLRASHRMEIDQASNRASVYVDPAVVRPDGRKPAEYGFYEHERGGEHAWLQNTYDEIGQAVLDEMAAQIARELGDS